MARISLVICDYCKDTVESVPNRISLTLQHPHVGDTIEAEICDVCAIDLKALFASSTKPQVMRAGPVNAKPERAAFVAPASITTLEGNASVKIPTKELLDHEVAKVPSQFNKSSAEKKVAAVKGSCPHHYKKTNDSNHIICADAPPNIRGGYADFRGCGKILSDDEL